MEIALFLITFFISQFNFGLAAQCRTTNDHKNYTCVGFRFKEFVVSRLTRQQILRVKVYDCKETEITKDSLFFPNTENLTISCNIQNIQEDAFQNFNHLQELNLSNNALFTFPNNVFVPLGVLWTLNLSTNNFEKLFNEMFEGLNHLKKLIFSYNKISNFDLKVFDRTRTLEELYLDNNHIDFLPSRIFSKLRKLKVLNLSYNKIINLGEAISRLYSLIYLNLSHNLIQELPSGVFININLEILDLSHNKLKIVSEYALKLQVLKELYLQNNEISLLDITGIGLNSISLSVLDLMNNRLVFLEESFIRSAKNLILMKLARNPWDCWCLDKINIIRNELSLKVSPSDQESDEAICVVGDLNDCIVDKNNLTIYYEMYLKQFD